MQMIRLININILLSAMIKSYLYAQKIISRAIYKLREYNNKCNTTIFTSENQNVFIQRKII
jgi:hypothetical protein